MLSKKNQNPRSRSITNVMSVNRTTCLKFIHKSMTVNGNPCLRYITKAIIVNRKPGPGFVLGYDMRYEVSNVSKIKTMQC